jgi:hypothetical protein
VGIGSRGLQGARGLTVPTCSVLCPLTRAWIPLLSAECYRIKAEGTSASGYVMDGMSSDAYRVTLCSLLGNDTNTIGKIRQRKKNITTKEIMITKWPKSRNKCRGLGYVVAFISGAKEIFAGW